MRVLITGANGYVGRACVAEALRQGHAVHALVRRGDVDGALAFRGDLSSPALAAAMEGVDAVIHTAASLAGDEEQMMRDTVDGTRALMTAVHAQARKPRVVITSSMSVYGADCPANSVISEDSPREMQPQLRDAYTRAKMAQEDIVDQMRDGVEVWMLRIGAVFGPNRLWNGHIGVVKGPILVRLGKTGDIPLSHVGNTARALVQAATIPAQGIEIINVLDDDLPNRVEYLAALKAGGWSKIVIPAPWTLFARIGQAFGWLPGLPGLLRGPVLRARMMPLQYSNDRMKERLRVTPHGTVLDNIAAAHSEERS